MSAYDIPDEAIDAAGRIYGGQIPDDGLRQIIDAALPFILPGEVAEAEKRGAEKATAETIMGGQRYAVVWALREAAKDWRRNGLMWDNPDEETNTDLRVARSLDERADRIEQGGLR